MGGEAGPGPLRRLIEWWALLGGMVLLGIALMTTWSAFSGWMFGKPLFTARAGPRTLAAFGLFAGLLALGIALLLTWRTWAGLIDYRKYVETTAILKIPIWTAYVPSLASLGLLVLACLISLFDAWRALRAG